jgi:hypothetical protein
MQTNKPLADRGLISYPYRGRYGWIMIGATDHLDALREAARATGDAVTNDRLEIWVNNAKGYVPAEW